LAHEHTQHKQRSCFITTHTYMWGPNILQLHTSKLDVMILLHDLAYRRCISFTTAVGMLVLN